MRHNVYGYLLLAALGFGCSQSPTASKGPITDAAKLREVAPKYAATVTAADLSKHLHILASDEYEGRNTGEKGQKMAAEYIAREFREDGLVGPVKSNATNPYYQTFDLEKSQWGDGHITIGTEKYLMMQDFFVIGSSSAFQSEQAADIVFAGYGIDSDKYSDYSNLTDVTGKTVVILAGEPKGPNGNYLISGTQKTSDWGNDYRQKRNAATKRGAKSVIIVTGTNQGEFNSLTQRYKAYATRPSIGLKSTSSQPSATTIFISPVAGAALLSTTPDKLMDYGNQVAKTGKPVVAKFTAVKNVKIKTERKSAPLPTENVLGYIEGTDKKDEVIVVTAHYDHVGVDSTLQGDKIFNGANDDGSGTVAVIELAEAFAQAKKDGFGPRRSILFMTVTAEEKGLLGSEYYSENPIFPLENTVANVNIDMIGRMDKDHEKTNDSNYIYVIGSDKLSSELHQINEEMNKKHINIKLDYTYNDENDPNRFYYRSDHYNFAKHNIPIVFYFNGVHDDYHQPSDEVEKILFDSAEKVARLAFHVVWELANRDNRIVVDSNKK
jgi:hypothetical protein